MSEIFEEDELIKVEIPTNATVEWLLEQDGIFFLKDVSKILGFNSKVKRKVKRLAIEDKNAYTTIGVRKAWNHWIVRMKVFKQFYESNLRSEIRSVPKGINGNELLEMKGIFKLSEVCLKIPFTSHQIRYQAKKLPNSHEVMGVWKDETNNCYLVDMEGFSAYVKKVWNG